MVSQNPDGSFTVTLADVYAEVRKCQDAILAMQPQQGTLNDHEDRLRGLEKWKYALPTSLVLAFSSAIVGAVELITRK